MKALIVAIALAIAGAGDGGSGTYLVTGSMFYFDLANSGTTTWQAFYLVAPVGTSFVGAATAGENTARCVSAQPDGTPNELECGPLTVGAGVHVSLAARMTSAAACGAAFQLYVSSTAGATFTRAGDATSGGSCTAAPATALRPPTVHGSPLVGRTLTATAPVWSSAPSSVGYRWQRCTSSRCVAIAGATALRLELTRGDAGHSVRIVATAVIDGQDVGSASARVPVRTRSRRR